jgi:hypothetical protein
MELVATNTFELKNCVALHTTLSPFTVSQQFCSRKHRLLHKQKTALDAGKSCAVFCVLKGSES